MPTKRATKKDGHSKENSYLERQSTLTQLFAEEKQQQQQQPQSESSGPSASLSPSSPPATTTATAHAGQQLGQDPEAQSSHHGTSFLNEFEEGFVDDENALLLITLDAERRYSSSSNLGNNKQETTSSKRATSSTTTTASTTTATTTSSSSSTTTPVIASQEDATSFTSFERKNSDSCVPPSEINRSSLFQAVLDGVDNQQQQQPDHQLGCSQDSEGEVDLQLFRSLGLLNQFSRYDDDQADDDNSDSGFGSDSDSLQIDQDEIHAEAVVDTNGDDDDDLYGEADDGLDLTEEQAREVTTQFTQQVKNQDEIFERMEENETRLTQQAIIVMSQSQREEEDDGGGSSVAVADDIQGYINDRVPAAKRARLSSIGRQTSVCDYFKRGAEVPQQSFPKNSKDIVFCGGKPFKRGETHGFRETLASDDNELVNYFVTLKEFCRRGTYLAAEYDPDYGCFVDLRDTFLGRKESEKLARSPRFKSLSKNDRLKAFRLKGIRSLASGDPILLRLLDSKPIPNPKPSLLYEEAGEAKTNHIDVAYFFRRSHAWVRKDLPSGTPIRVLDLFAGVGGMGLGFEKAGMRVTHAVDNCSRVMAYIDKYVREHFRNNGDVGIEVFDEGVYSFLSNAQMGYDGYVQPGCIDHVHASSPCQGYSDANRLGGKNDEANNRLIFAIILYVRFLRPRTASLENVTGLLKKRNRHYLQRLMRLFIQEGYQVRIVTLDAARYGDPQHRSRVFLLASRNDHKLIDSPKPTHGPGTQNPYVTVRDKLKYLETVEPAKTKETGRVFYNGKAIYNHWRDDRARPTKEENWMKLPADRPAGTVLRRKYIEHYSKEEPITCRHRAELQSFPSDFRFFGTQMDVNDAIGNAVPVELATAVARSIRESYNFSLCSESQLEG